MTKILAPSNVGFTKREQTVRFWWLPSIAYPWQWVEWTTRPTFLASYKSPTVHSDGKSPTDYCRMINKIIPGGSVNCDNVAGKPSPSRYFYRSDIACTVDVKSNSSLPYGCDIANGQVFVPAWMEDAVIADCIQQMNGIAANIYEDLGQAAEPLKLYVGTYRTIILLYLSARAGKWNHVRRELSKLGSDIPRSIGNGWLMYFYGIKPMISTLEELVKRDEPKFGSFEVRSRREISESCLGYLNVGSGVFGGGSVKVQAQAQFRAEYAVTSNLSFYWRMGITGQPADALVTAWALAPWSFVVDWILPVEQFLLSLVWSPALTYQGGFVGRRHAGGGNLIDNQPWFGPPYTGSLPRYVHQVRFYQRKAYPFRVPPVGLNMRFTLNRNQIISAAALIVTR